MDGEAIGINSMNVTSGISFAIPIDYAKEFLQKSQLVDKSDQPRRRRFLGITMMALTPQIIDQLKDRMNYPYGVDNGIIVYRVIQDSPADSAGIEPRDVITHINGIEIHNSSDVYGLLESNEDLLITLVRDNVKKRVTVTPQL